MDCSGQIRTILLGHILVLCLGMSVGQRDCTGVDCPVMDNCIEEVLERGACCASCLKRGCACEGYQYYDCLNAGFRGGKVPEGESYFVDFGSTECSCPSGGGRITCHFIPCPDIPQNCIETITPMDGCPQCERIGCVHQSQKYEAGHTFQMSPCEVCHCPNDGGSLMCSPVPGCDPQKVKKPMLASTVEDRDSEPHPGTFSNFLPLYKEDPTDTPTDEDYDYMTDLTTADTQDVVEPAEPTSSPPSFSETSSSHASFGEGPRQELREAQGAYETRNAEEHMTSPPSAADTITSRLQESTTAADKAQAPKHHGPPREASEGQSRRHAETQRGAQERDLPHTAHSERNPRHKTHHEHRDSHAPGQGDNHLPDSRDGRQDNALPSLKFSPSRPPPVNVREDRGHPSRRQSQTLLHYHTGQEKEHGSSSPPYSHQLSAKELVEVCCEAGEKWASVHGHCSNMAAVREDTHSICWSAQKQCCSGSLKERKCLAGVTAAKQGDACELDDNDHCGVDSYKECCSCCSLGLHFRKEGLPCEAHQYLGLPCSHVFLTCCEGEEAASWSTLRQRPPLQPTTPPKRVSDSPYPKEAFSIGDAEDAENTVEGAEGLRDLDECKLEGKLCHHTCINTQGSYVCACYPGYTLQEDGHNCEPETDAEEENRLMEQEHESPAAAETTTAPAPPTTTSTSAPTTIFHDPCAGNGPCAHRCTPVEGRPQCSCFPGFSLAADSHSCEDVNECLLMAHNCQLNERCVNTVGHYFCERLIVCPAGFQENNNVCEDIDECAQRTHNCQMGYECRNTPGSFTCQITARCSSGFTQDASGHCVDIDECSSTAQPCSSGYNCINTVGSYTCQRKVIICSRGYHASPDGNRCIDVDECQTRVHRCGDGQTCHNLPGTYRCECQPGYQYDMFRKMCVDVNECWRYPGRLCAQTCENTPGSYQCSCTAGFRLSSDGKNCEDVNECLNNPCSQECANIYGSYQCYCRQGYHLREDGHTCDDIDECSQSMGHMCTFKCVNVEGSYQCACPEYGYTMSPNGRSCLDIDECAIGTHNCSVSETCYNIQGDHRCLSFSCPDNYRHVSDTRCERINCPNFVECQNAPLRITYYQLSFQTNSIIPAQIFRIGPSPAYSGDNIIISIPRGNEENYFSTRKLNTYTGAIYLHRQVREPQDFLIDVEMRLWRQGTFTTFLARIYVFITAPAL
ncbi:fibulin-2-like [Alosa sapidissima]|uniref:fibulin-2-like n=1 Tax=Alosa sapidissima TaxID=34773 RepID=UPI001C09F696|nr:fibulin-2-like [Alosa sapidissima]